MHPTWKEYPHLLAELDPDGNKDLTLYGNPVHVYEVAPTTDKRLDWKCAVCDNQWTTSGMNRTHNKSGCPYCCVNRLHSDGRNSLAQTHPELSEEYQGDATKVMAGTNKNGFWKCSDCEHEWETRIKNRAVMGVGCPVCNRGCLHSDGRNSLAVVYPELAEEYQGDPTQVFAGGNERHLWKCSDCEHEWKTTIKARAGCPFCTGATGLHSDGRNALSITHPELAEECLDDPTKLFAGGDSKVRWKCLVISDSPCGYEWKASAYNRTKRWETGCPVCCKKGFRPDKLGYYYVHKILNESRDILMYKGGISGNWKRRLSRLQGNLPDNLTMELHEVIEFKIGQEAQDLEKTLLRMAAEEGWKAPPRDFDGGHELFLENPLDHARLKGLLSPKHK